jgi:uncharacterized membrane protein
MRPKMKASRLTVCFALCMLLLLLLPIYKVNCQNYYTYSVQINGDSSALWKITYFSDVNAIVDTWYDFQTKVFNLVDSAANLTRRDMAIDQNSLQINTTISSDSKITEYSFRWQNFSVIQGNEIIFGDVFTVKNFFSQLYGDGALQISYPSTFSIKSVAPPPNQEDDSAKTLGWARTQDLVNSKSNIILTSAPSNENSKQSQWQEYTIIVPIVAVAAALSFVGLYTFRRRRKVNGIPASTSIVGEPYKFESEEEKILKILKTSGGSMRQSAITEQCRFSKAKTSQLLAVLEKRGDITRYKKGRDKIVNLTERVKGE